MWPQQWKVSLAPLNVARSGYNAGDLQDPNNTKGRAKHEVSHLGVASKRVAIAENTRSVSAVVNSNEAHRTSMVWMFLKQLTRLVLEGG